MVIILFKSFSNFNIIIGLQVIGDRAFFSAGNIVEIIVPSSLSYIGFAAFSYLLSLSSIKIKNGLSVLGDLMFESCIQLAFVSIPSTIISISNYVFSRCVGLTNVFLENGLSTIGAYMFDYSGLTTLSIPSSVNTIQNFAFTDCSALVCVTWIYYSSYRTMFPDNIFKNSPMVIDCQLNSTPPHSLSPSIQSSTSTLRPTAQTTQFPTLVPVPIILQPTWNKPFLYNPSIDRSYSPSVVPSFVPSLYIDPKIPFEEWSGLKQFYEASGGNNWSWLSIASKWNFSSYLWNYPCRDHWEGLNCSCNVVICHIIQINLNHHNLYGTVSFGIKRFSYLKLLSLSSNQIYGSLPIEINYLKMLTVLDVSKNLFTGSIPNFNLTSLQYLSLNNNNFVGNIPDFSF